MASLPEIEKKMASGRAAPRGVRNQQNPRTGRSLEPRSTRRCCAQGLSLDEIIKLNRAKAGSKAKPSKASGDRTTRARMSLTCVRRGAHTAAIRPMNPRARRLVVVVVPLVVAPRSSSLAWRASARYAAPWVAAGG